MNNTSEIDPAHFPIVTLAICLNLLAYTQLGLPSFAHTRDDEDNSVKLFESLWDKDKKESRTESKSGQLTYEPSTGKDGELSSFRILEGKNELISKSRSKLSAFQQFWLVHPVTKIVAPEKSDDPDRLINQFVGNKITCSPSPFVDINADGKPEVIVGTFSGGAHCCFSYKVYTLGSEAKLYAKLDGNDQQFAFVDLKGDGRCEALGYDFTFAYWNTDFADSPAPLVILAPTSTGYSLATDLMRTPTPDAVLMQTLVDASKKAIATETSLRKEKTADFSLAPELWKSMLNLIYAGHSQAAWTLLDQVWPEGKRALFSTAKPDGKASKPGSREEFKTAFLSMLKTSPYWEGVEKLNSGDKLFASANHSNQSNNAKIK